MVLAMTLLCPAGRCEEGPPGLERPVGMRLTPLPRRAMDLSRIPFRIIHETYRPTDGRMNWELQVINADGSNPVNLTHTPDLDEMYPHVSPDGTKIVFVVDEGLGRNRTRSVYMMNIDGSDRVKVAHNGREPCWSPDSKTIAYLEGEYDRYTTREYATSELVYYDVATGRRQPHVNRDLHHMYAICYVPGVPWMVGVVHGGMGYSDTILAFELQGQRVFDLAPWRVKGCRPDVGSDGRTMVWGETDWELCVGTFDVSTGTPQVLNPRKIVACSERKKVYHVDLSPDNQYITFSYGPERGGQQVGGRARGWNICVGDLDGNWVQITTDGNDNKEPDWIPIAATDN